MQVSFEPRVPYNKSNPMAVSHVTYEIPWTKENEVNMVEAALKKYGPYLQAVYFLSGVKNQCPLQEWAVRAVRQALLWGIRK
ncbi:Uncharacterised protein [Leclercia adecarboxylata]|uniref:Uncharacterized protein n=1 Tax=Leclercia adecarboxylata TaxID=83655 RepID=A0A4U9HT78_9ENTR|nr:Uncharacterised protein [Leclercia adecarboxylata]